MSKAKGSFKTRSDFSLDEWKEIYKRALKMRIEKKLSPREIGNMLNISPNTVATWIYGTKQIPNGIRIDDEICELRNKV